MRKGIVITSVVLFAMAHVAALGFAITHFSGANTLVVTEKLVMSPIAAIYVAADFVYSIRFLAIRDKQSPLIIWIISGAIVTFLATLVLFAFSMGEYSADVEHSLSGPLLLWSMSLLLSLFARKAEP